MNKRRPSALHTLDGIRAIAILWVYAYHSIGDFMGGKLKLKIREFSSASPLGILFTPFVNGDLGVDIFFVLSGFLISFILLKETDKYEGRIDVFNFYRSRAIRLWFAMAPYCFLAGALGITVWYWLPPLFFVGNLIGHQMVHLWSISVEFQFYLISPMIVYVMKRGESHAWGAALIILTISTLSRCMIGLELCGKGLWNNNDSWTTDMKCHS